jgi:integrase
MARYACLQTAQVRTNIEIIARLLGHNSVNMTWTHYGAWVPELQERLETAVRGAIDQI